MTAQPLTTRLLKHRWSPIRLAVDGMEPGEVRKYPAKDYYKARAAVDHSNDAYAGKRLWRITSKNKRSTITRRE